MRSGTRYFQGILAAAVVVLLVPGTTFAYVGPGAGISMLGALWGLIIGVVMALGVILFWPIRMMIRKAKGNKADGKDASKAKADDKDGSTDDEQSKPESPAAS